MAETKKYKCSFCEKIKEKVIIPDGKESPVICYECVRECKNMINKKEQ